MIIGEPWGLLALAGLPALVALHLWRARHAPRPTSALFLWPDDHRVLASGRRRAPLVLRGSFWLEVLAVLAATWWLADIHWSQRAPARHVVVVLDDRWRMQAVADGSSAAQRLRTALDARLAQLAAGDRVTLIASGTPPRLLVGPAAEALAARSILATWHPEAAWHDLDAALTLASGIGGGGAEILVASDRAPARLPDGIGLLATGRRLATSGLADARWWRGGTERIVAVVHGSTERAPVLRIADVVIAASSTNKGMYLFDRLPPMPEGAQAELALPGEDPLAIDDRVTLVRPPARLVHAGVTLDGAIGVAVRAALTAAGAILSGPASDLVIGPAAPAGAWSLRLEAGEAPPSLGPFTARRDHPLLADLDLSGALWSGAATSTTGSPLLISGGQVLLSESRRGVDRDLVLHLDPARSTLTRHPAWPGLFANLVAWRAARLPGVADPNPRCGQQVNAVLPSGIAAAELADPSGIVHTLRAGPEGDLSIPGLSTPGRWSLRWPGGSAQISALPLDPRQADLADASSSEHAAVTAGRAEVERSREPLAALLPLVLAAAAALAACAVFAREERS